MFFCLAVNMLELADLTVVLDLADAKSEQMTRTEKAQLVEGLLRKRAGEKDIPLVLRR